MVAIKLEAANVSAYCALDVGDTFHGWPILSTVPGSPQMIVDIPNEAELGRLDALVDLDQVVNYREAHADYKPLGWPVKGPAPDAVPGDTFPLIGATDAIRQRGRYGARTTRLGIVDTGVDVGHVAFDGKDIQGDTQDAHGHGTHVASTAASSWGIASDSAIYMLNVLPNGSGTEAEVANGFRALADGGCDVISASLGGSPSQVIDAAVEYAKGKGSLVVCAAGNDGDQTPNPGSPARVATVSVYAIDRAEHYAIFTDGKAWATTGSQGVAISAAARGTRSGVATMSGTSMATPHISGLLCLLRAAGLSPQACLDYLAQHRQAIAGCTNGVLKLAADFGDTAPPPPPEGDVDFVELEGKLAEAQNQLGNPPDGARFQEPSEKATKIQIRAWAKDVQARAGIAWDYMQQVREAFPKAEPPVEEPPTPPAVVGHAGSYGGHDPAVDAYLNGEWGPHHGIWCVAPCDGAVELYQFPTPLDAYIAMDAATRERYRQLFQGWTCVDPALFPSQALDHPRVAAADSRWVQLRVDPFQTMYVPVFRPAAPFRVAGVALAWFGTGHVDGANVAVGRVSQGTRLWRTWDSGIRFEERGIVARAAHGHFICGRTSILSPNGDLPGWYAIQAFEFPLPRQHVVPGPSDYLTGGYIAGRPRSDWANRAIPPMPT